MRNGGDWVQQTCRDVQMEALSHSVLSQTNLPQALSALQGQPLWPKMPSEQWSWGPEYGTLAKTYCGWSQIPKE